MPQINDAPNVAQNVRIDNHRYNANRAAMKIPAQTNCSLCTCAAVITHGKGQVFTSKDVAKKVPLKVKPHKDFTNNPDALYGALQTTKIYGQKGWQGARESTHMDILESQDLQIRGMTWSVKQELGISDVWKMGDQEHERKTLDECTAYMQKMGDRGFVFAVLSLGDGHWNFAHKVGDKIQYVDYQMNHPDLGDGNPVSADTFQKGLGGGDADGGNLGVVLAFQCQDHFPEGAAT